MFLFFPFKDSFHHSLFFFQKFNRLNVLPCKSINLIRVTSLDCRELISINTPAFFISLTKVFLLPSMTAFIRECN